ncbi:MAG: TAXI family TRAP transporter solute-binding subunit [Spirochaetia bacterium]
MALERRRLTEEIAAALQQKIIELDLKEGDKLPSHAALADDLSISIPSLREGLQVLSTLGIIRLEHGRGTIVARPSISDYAGSVDPGLLARSYSLDESITVLITALRSLVRDLGRSQRRDYPLEPAIEKIRSAADSAGAVKALGEFYSGLIAPLKRPLFGDIIRMTVKIICSAPYISPDTHLRSNDFADSLTKFKNALESGSETEINSLLTDQELLLRSLVPTEQRLSCLTGSIGGTFYSAGLELSAGLRDLSGLILRVKPSAGGLENLRTLARGNGDIAFTQAHVAEAAYRGEEPFDVPFSDLRMICRTHALDLWIVASSSSGIDSLRSLKGKRISLGTRGGETSRIARELLLEYGHESSAYEERFLSISRAAEALSRGEIDLLFYLTGGMGTALHRLSETHSLKVIGIEPDILHKLCGKTGSWRRSKVSAGPGGEEVPTLRVETLLVCGRSLSDERVKKVRQAVWHAAKTSNILQPLVPKPPFPVPLHPGAGNA